MTLGEYKVGITFNPGGNPQVDTLKRLAAAFIDEINSFASDNPEVGRLKALAMTNAEDAAMWAVKAVTKGPME
jgi:hypothetical protein